MHLKRQLCIFFCDFGIFLEFLFFMWTQRMLTPAHPKYSFFPLFCFQNRGSGGQNVTQPPETGLYMTRTLQTHFLVILWRFWAFLEWFWWIFHVDATHANACPPKILICSDSRGVWWGWKNGKITKKSIQTLLKHSNDSPTRIEIGLDTGGKFLVWSTCGSCRKSHITKSALD